MTAPAREAGAADYQPYGETAIRILLSDGWIELRPVPAPPALPPPALPPAALESIGAAVHVVTAWNPNQAVMHPLEMNQRLQQQLTAELDAAGERWWPAVGVSLEGGWAEASVALGGWERWRALALGRRWGQLAVFEWRPRDAEVAILGTDGSVRSYAVVHQRLEQLPCPMRALRCGDHRRCSPPADGRPPSNPGHSTTESWQHRQAAVLAAAGCGICHDVAMAPDHHRSVR